MHCVEDESCILGVDAEATLHAFKHYIPPAMMMELQVAKRTTTIVFGKGAMKIAWEQVVTHFSEVDDELVGELSGALLDNPMATRRADFAAFTGGASVKGGKPYEPTDEGDRLADYVAKEDNPCELCLMVGWELQADTHCLANCFANPCSAKYKIGAYRQRVLELM